MSGDAVIPIGEAFNLMQIRLTQENEQYIGKRVSERPGLTTASKLANYFISMGIQYEPWAACGRHEIVNPIARKSNRISKRNQNKIPYFVYLDDATKRKVK